MKFRLGDDVLVSGLWRGHITSCEGWEHGCYIIQPDEQHPSLGSIVPPLPRNVAESQIEFIKETPKMAYIVIASEGDYDEHREWPVAVYTTLTRAEVEKIVEQKREEARERVRIDNDWWIERSHAIREWDTKNPAPNTPQQVYRKYPPAERINHNLSVEQTNELNANYYKWNETRLEAIKQWDIDTPKVVGSLVDDYEIVEIPLDTWVEEQE